MNHAKTKRYALICTVALCVLAAIGYWMFFSQFSKETAHTYIYIDDDDTLDSIVHKLSKDAHSAPLLGFRTIAAVTGYGQNIRAGRYETGNELSAFALLRQLKNGRQTPLMLTVPSVRTMDFLAARLAKQLKADSASLAEAFHNEEICRKFDCDTATLPCIFLPNTYEVFWTITPEQLIARMARESKAYWTEQRKAQARAAGLTEKEVITLASIVDQETAYTPEKPKVAGMYLNRLRQGMKLQADPTVKFALKQFRLRRILHEHLTVNSPYNTYLNEGLPPGPIAIPSISSIEAVLNHAKHDYIYMCAKEDFSGSHNFATTYKEHLSNARKYTKALNNRGIK